MGEDSQVPSAAGSYALRLCLTAPVQLAVGCLGVFDFPAGDYIYLGSARGPGGLRARLSHHGRAAAHPRWHLDWLRPNAHIVGGWYSTAPDRLECAWSQALLRLPGAAAAAPGFGASDCVCGCPAHLILLPGELPLDCLTRTLYEPLPSTGRLVFFASIEM